MGMELVELAIEVEETFGFTIPDEDAAALDTVGKLYDYILERRFEGKEQGCLTSVAFYRLRRALMSVFGVARDDIRRSLDLAEIIPRRRRQRWSGLQAALGLRLPSLVRPAWVTAAATALALALAIGAPTVLAAKSGDARAFWLVPWMLGLAAYVFYRATKPLAVAFQSNSATVAGLTKSIVLRNYGAISDACQRANREEVWDTLRTLIAGQLGVRRDDVTKEASFVRDLGAG